MAKPDPPLKGVKTLYHFTDLRNIASIRKHGGVWSLAKLVEKGIEIPAPGGNKWSHDADGYKGLDEYVHLCFRPVHPMEYEARHREEEPIEETIFLRISRDILLKEGVLFTADVSNKVGVDTCSLEEAEDLLDVPILYATPSKSNTKRMLAAEKCEILVPDHVPLEMILNFPKAKG
jgi:ssDNA thymidine ADP-ribosyltransferase, DarT